MLERTLTAEGYEVSTVADSGKALVLVEESVPDLVVLDVAMPGLDGFAVSRRLRAKGLVLPVLLLTARDAVADKVAGLDAGADDYLLKPFAPEELLARVRALLRRGREATPLLAYGDLSFDTAAPVAHRGGTEIALSNREADLLELLLRNARHVVTGETALAEVWGSSYAAPSSSTHSSSAVSSYSPSLELLGPRTWWFPKAFDRRLPRLAIEPPTATRQPSTPQPISETA